MSTDFSIGMTYLPHYDEECCSNSFHYSLELHPSCSKYV